MLKTDAIDSIHKIGYWMKGQIKIFVLVCTATTNYHSLSGLQRTETSFSQF